MNVFLAAFVAFGIVMAGMAIGVIVSNRRITGSCGGLANMKAEDGEPMCECGARTGESCGADPDRRFDLDQLDDEDPLVADDHSGTHPRSGREAVAV